LAFPLDQLLIELLANGWRREKSLLKSGGAGVASLPRRAAGGRASAARGIFDHNLPRESKGYSECQLLSCTRLVCQ